MSQSTGHPAARVEGLSLAYGTRQILDSLRLTVQRTSSVSVMGASGSGKSSLLSCMLGLLRPDTGTVEIDGTPVEFGRRARSARLRREKIGVIFQSGELFPELSPRENVALSGLLAGMSPAVARDRAAELLEALGVPTDERSVTEFSGGEQQRTAVARALMNEPVLLLADEPTGSLDPESRDQVIDMLFEVPRRFDCGLVVVTHDPVVASRANDQVRLVEGRLVESSLV